MNTVLKIALATFVLTLMSGDAVGEERPNIIIIMADDMGFSDIGCFGGEIDTPNLNTLAKNGVRFTQFYNTGRCCPTRASLLTGLYSHQAGIGHMTGDKGVPSYQGYLNDRCLTIAEALKPVGYRTLVSGKWHVGGRPAQWPLKRGFDRFYGIPQGGGIYFRLKKGRQLVLDDKSIQPPDDWYVTDAFTDHAIEFVEESVTKKKPFFLYLAHIAPHWPLKAPEKDIQKYLGKYQVGWDQIREDRYQRMVKMGLIKKNWPLAPRDVKSIPWTDEMKKKEMDLRMATYAAQVDRIDQNVGKLMSKLKKLGADQNTLVMFLSDNGGSPEGGRRGFMKGKPGAKIGTADSFASYGLSWANASNVPFRRYKSWVHEGGISTPLIVHWPARLKRKDELEQQVGHVIDLMPTCLDVAGASYPKMRKGKEVTPLPGTSLLPAFEGKTIERDALFWEHEGNRAVRVGKWKLVATHRGAWELYDLEADRTEVNDLAKKHPERVAELKQRYQKWAKDAGVMPWPVKK